MSITIFTDGSSKGNPGPGGWGAIVAYTDKVVELGGREEHTTNNRMELSAAIYAIESLKQSEVATIYSDSTYVVKGITEWIHGWHRNNWKTAGKKPVENKDLWLRLFDAIQNKDLKWKVIPGHAGIHANERCDEIATSFADNLLPVLYDGSRAGYTTKLEVNG
ncbi:MAG: ribonuclease HI [Parcubacteria bacterium C7867-005]|nr:MAG: ribonuclease HI [Parcubacteria bacterium C7867-005]